MDNINTLINKLPEKRLNGDSEADAFIREILADHELNEINIFFSRLMYNNQLHSDSVPKEFRQYIEENSGLPDWADMQKIELAQQTFTQIGPAFILAYFCKSLPECYACGKGAEILFKTGRLTKHTRRRIAQTAQFVLDVMSPGGLEPGGRGIATSMKVRLAHASIRFYFMNEVKKGKIDYDANETGYPINQEDYLGTLMAFSYVVVEGMEKLGVAVSVEEREAILHLWKCIGHLIGIDDLQLIENYEDAGKLWAAITGRQYLSTNEGVALSNLLIEFLDEILPGKALDDVVPIMMHRLMGKEVFGILKIRTPKKYNPFAIISFILAIWLIKFESKGMISRLFSHYVNMKLMINLEKYIAEGESTTIFIPESLKKDWHMHSISKSIINKARR
jgi:hypothetical protein